MATCDPATLLASASCFSCLSKGQLELLRVQLLCEIYNASGGGSNEVEVAIACSDETSDLAAAAAVATFRMPFAMTVTGVRASVTTAPAGSSIEVDINESGASILSTVISIDAGATTSTTSATPPVISDSALADDAEIKVDIDQIGSGTAGAGLKITMIGTRV